MTWFGMAIDMARCTGCQTCVVACQMHHALRPGVAWCAVDALEWGRWPDADRAFLPRDHTPDDTQVNVQVMFTVAHQHTGFDHAAVHHGDLHILQRIKRARKLRILPLRVEFHNIHSL